MSPIIQLPKFIAKVTFRGFDIDPTAVEKMIGRAASLLVRRGESRIPGGTPFKKSAASWSKEFARETRIDEMIPALLADVGGVAHLLAIKGQVLPEFFEVDISMWIIDSEEQEGGFIEVPTIGALAVLGASLSLGFYRINEK